MNLLVVSYAGLLQEKIGTLRKNIFRSYKVRILFKNSVPQLQSIKLWIIMRKYNLHSCKTQSATESQANVGHGSNIMDIS